MNQYHVDSMGDSVTGQIFLGGKFLKKNSSIKYRVFVAKCTDLKNQCWSMVKICPEIINFLGCLPRKNKILPRKKICPNFGKIYPKNTNLPSHRVQSISFPSFLNFLMSNLTSRDLNLISRTIIFCIS